ncbi:MAG: ADOP family duplicated permease [Candidatus Solibacter sp.]|nr:ADOP family duplicated permease [Candidatus Solibacter sp.]
MAPFLSQAWQSWKSAKATAFLVVVAFTVGIGSATSIYAVIHSLLLAPLPYAHGERFVSVLGGSLDNPNPMSSLNLKDVREYQQRIRSFDVFGWMQFTNFNLTAPGQPQYVNGVYVTPGLANSLGVNPRIGRWFRDLSGGPVAVIAHGLWQRLGADVSIVGKTITLSGRMYTVAGVMPPGFNLPLAGVYSEAQTDVWMPLDPLGAGPVKDGGNFCYARLRPGATVAQASGEAKSIAREIAGRDPASHRNYTVRVDGLHGLTTKEIRPTLWLLFAAALLLLSITCANVGGLLLARSVARARETAVRVALGAGLRQLALQYILEGLLVSTAGAVGGLLFSFVLVRAIGAYGSEASARAGLIAVGWPAIGFAIGTAFVTCVLASMAPLWQAARTLPNDVLSEGVRASAGARSTWLSRSFVVAEVALAFVLLAVSTVLVSELYRVTRVWPGFDPANLLTFQLSFAAEGIPGKPSQYAYQTRLLDAVQAIPGVRGAGVVNQLPLQCCFITTIYQEGASPKPSRGEDVVMLVVSRDYFRTIGIPLRLGRFLRDGDNPEKLLPVVINQAAVKRYWPDRDPVGVYGHFNGPKGDRFQVVGVVGDVKNRGLDSPTEAEIYLYSAVVPTNPMHFVVRSALAPKTLIPAVRRAIQGVNAAQPIHEIKMMSAIVRESEALKLVASSVTGFFAFAALLMATLGTYGVVSYSMRQRTVEMGTRMALGATSRDLLSLVMGSGLRMAAWGIVIGCVAAVAATWLLMREFHIDDPGVLPFILSAVIVASIALASSLVPAWRATLLSPLVAIRNEPGSTWESARHGIGQFFERWTAAGARGEDLPPSPDADLMTALIDASRQATGFREAIRAALEALRANIEAESALLLEGVSAEEYRATASAPDQGWGAYTIPRNGLLLNRLRAYGAPLPIHRGELDAARRWAIESKPEHLAEIATLENCGARLAVALRTNKEVLGVLLLGTPAGREGYSRAEKRVLRGCADQFALRVVEQEKVLRDLALAAEVQKRLLPRQGLETAVASLTGLNLPARSVGGDYYDFLDLGGDHTGIALADVAGKGIAAALIMSVVQASLRVISSERDISLPQLAARMNYFLYRSTGPNSYATFFYAQLDQHTRELRYVNAGHNAPYLLRAGGDGTVEELTTGGTIIGMFPQTRYEEGTLALHTGDVLIVFTDGVTEALNPTDEEFGEERLKDLLRLAGGLPVEEMSARIAAELKNWIQDAAQYDDLTFLLMKVK